MAYMVVDKSALAQDMKAHVVEIIFDRMDGDRRIAKCTLLHSFLPDKWKSHEAVNEVVNSTDPKTLHIWDVNANDWRTLKLDRILSCQIINY